ncbi:MAG: FkbM family methyltransferase [Planctomycetes bacterium]|nr:FkbM family methyltransferase [Planctomycetota bacterium]
MDIGIVDAIERELWVGGEWDTNVKNALFATLRKGDAFLDLGANIGYFSLLASKIVGDSGTVVSVEPSIRALRKLTHHLWLNHCRNVVVLSCAAGDCWKQVAMGLANESNIGGSALLTAGAVTQRTEPVMLAPVDDLLESVDFRLRMIKVDLEGFELAALRGCRRLIAKHRPFIVCEVTEKFLAKYGDSAKKLVEFFRDLDYEVRSLYGKNFELVDTDQLSDLTRQFDVLFSPRESTPPNVRAA